MAVLALHLLRRMGVSQLEARLVVVEPRHVLPVALAVARLALRSQRRRVLVVLPVAADAVLRRLLVVAALVAVRALHVAVLAEQRELRPGVIELRFFLPTDLDVASRAVAAQAALVTLGPVVVLLVAVDARGAELVLVQRAGVAIAALAVRCLPRNVYLVSVSWLKTDGFQPLMPWQRIAALAVKALVSLGAVVVLLVAADAGARRVFVVGALLVAVGALGARVLVFQRKARLVVIELRLFLPVVLGVAVGALCSERALVHVVLLVTGAALRRPPPNTSSSARGTCRRRPDCACRAVRSRLACGRTCLARSRRCARCVPCGRCGTRGRAAPSGDRGSRCVHACLGPPSCGNPCTAGPARCDRSARGTWSSPPPIWRGPGSGLPGAAPTRCSAPAAGCSAASAAPSDSSVRPMQWVSRGRHDANPVLVSSAISRRAPRPRARRR